MREDRKDRLELPVVGMDRREALKLLALAAAAPAALTACGAGEEGAEGAGQGRAAAGGEPVARGGAAASNPRARGDAWDPDLVNPELRWEKILTEDEREGLAALCDVILPADDRSPAASAVGAHDFIDEWVSAPYDFARNDLVLVRGGLGWLDREAARRFGQGLRFRDLAPAQQHALCDDIA
ncbi:MAG: gluconate 2-dehydrogenase subunit 3 family protein, partial [Longimicrobiales bacterium]|nr:gluconate 2-dehydrogenase subunit 3 family protein [Longimicrobiales bacterium]